MHKSPRAVRAIAATIALPLLLLGAACTKQQATPVSTGSLPPGLKPAASILDLMHDPIDRSANALWEAVYVSGSGDGSDDVLPASDEEWLALRRQALMLMEAANLLVTEGRPVASPGQDLEGGAGEGVLTPAQAQAAIDNNRQVFNAFSAALQGVGASFVAAIDVRDAEQFMATGDALQGACQGCHQRFWYPEQAQPAP